MTAKEYLQGIRNIELELRNKESRYKQLKEDICTLQSLDYSKDRVDGGQAADTGDKIARLDTLLEQINREWDILIRRRETAVRQIEQLSDPRHKAVLLERYIHCKSWEQVAVDLSFNYRWTLRIHGFALKEFEKILKEAT